MVTQDVKQQLRFIEDLDKIERKRHDEEERELLMKAAKSRTKTDDPEKEKLKAKAKEIQKDEADRIRLNPRFLSYFIPNISPFAGMKKPTKLP